MSTYFYAPKPGPRHAAHPGRGATFEALRRSGHRGRRHGATVAVGPRPIVLTRRGRRVAVAAQALAGTVGLVVLMALPTLERAL